MAGWLDGGLYIARFRVLKGLGAGGGIDIQPTPAIIPVGLPGTSRNDGAGHLDKCNLVGAQRRSSRLTAGSPRMTNVVIEAHFHSELQSRIDRTGRLPKSEDSPSPPMKIARCP